MYVRSVSKSLLTAIVFAVLIFTTQGLFAAGSDESAASEVPTIVWIHHYLGSISPEGDKIWLDELQKKTGVHVDLVKPTDAEYDVKVASMFAAGEQLDLVYVDPYQLQVLMDKNPGLFEPLDSRIKSSPVFSDTQKFPQKNWDTIRYKDGHIYGTQPVAGLNLGATLPVIRWDWAEKLGLASRFDGNKKPTADDYYDLLRAFTYGDPDGNGKQDTYGLALAGTLYETSPFFGAVGAVRMYAKDSSGRVYSPISQDNTIPVWQFLARLYKEKILEPNFVTNGSGNFRDMFMAGKVGMVVYWDNWIPRFNDEGRGGDPKSPYEARAIYPPVGPDGTSMLRRGGGAFSAMTSASKEKDAAFKVLEFFSTDAGAMLGTAGVEGYDYNVVNGKIVFTQVGIQSGQNHGMKPGFNWKIPWDVAPEWTDAMAIMANTKTFAQQGYGRDEGEWEETVGIDGARIIRGEVTPAQGLADMRKRLLDKKLVDF